MAGRLPRKRPPRRARRDGASLCHPNGGHGFLERARAVPPDGHIPSALFADLIEEFSDTEVRFPFTPRAEPLPPRQAHWGSTTTRRSSYTTPRSGSGHRDSGGCFEPTGTTRVAVLDGGFKKLARRGPRNRHRSRRAVSERFRRAPSARSLGDQATSRPSSTATPQARCSSARTPAQDSAARGRPAGHIPGSINMPAGRLIDRETNALPPGCAARRVRRPAGARAIATARRNRRVGDALALTLLGHRNVAVYDGSLTEWSADGDAAVVGASTCGSSQTKSVHA